MSVLSMSRDANASSSGGQTGEERVNLATHLSVRVEEAVSTVAGRPISIDWNLLAPMFSVLSAVATVGFTVWRFTK